MDIDSVTAVVAVYAAVVATGALALEVRRWFESGPRLVVRLMVPAVAISAAGMDDQEFIFVEVSNRGSSATTITNLGLFTFANLWKRLRRQADVSAIIPRPEMGSAGVIPFVLQPGERWTGAANFEGEVVEWAMTDRLYVAIHHTGSNKPALKRVRLSEDAKAKRRQGNLPGSEG